MDKPPTLFQSNHHLFYRYEYFFKGFMGCIGGFMIHLVIGSLYQWGLVNPYITSYFKLHGYEGI